MSLDSMPHLGTERLWNSSASRISIVESSR